MPKVPLKYEITLAGEYTVDTNDYDSNNPCDIAYYEKDWIASDVVEFIEMAFHEYPDPKITNVTVSPVMVNGRDYLFRKNK